MTVAGHLAHCHCVYASFPGEQLGQMPVGSSARWLSRIRGQSRGRLAPSPLLKATLLLEVVFVTFGCAKAEVFVCTGLTVAIFLAHGQGACCSYLDPRGKRNFWDRCSRLCHLAGGQSPWEPCSRASEGTKAPAWLRGRLALTPGTTDVMS